MPQMAPSLWLIIYLFMVFMIFLVSDNLFFFNKVILPVKSYPIFNSTMSIMWQ
uniref:ATP synthase F0 subunit 8 n=1 Tax=Metacrangonyx sp. n. DJ2019 TaxID=2606684 RepID=A0A5C0Q028_9CRUS|nr:ATP synthase F0 subunit 8 [Metacrangonyx sp. n. DJ2019]